MPNSLVAAHHASRQNACALVRIFCGNQTYKSGANLRISLGLSGILTSLPCLAVGKLYMFPASIPLITPILFPCFLSRLTDKLSYLYTLSTTPITTTTKYTQVK